MSGQIPLPRFFLKLLEELREPLNTKVRQRAALGVPLDSSVWLEHIRSTIAPIVAAVYGHAEERAKRTLLELYDVSLELFSAGHFRDSGSSLGLLQLWRDVLPSLPKVVGLDPRRVVGCLSNAVLHLNQLAPQTADTWLRILREGGEYCEHPKQLLTFGMVAAWRAGLAQHRSMACKLAVDLPDALAGRALDLPNGAPMELIGPFLRSMLDDPWTRLPGSSSTEDPVVEEVSRCGNFRGLGGHFLAPPRVFVADGWLHATDDHGTWRVCADRFGTTLHRVPETRSNRGHTTKDVHVDSTGRISWKGLRLQRDDLAKNTSVGFDGRTLAVTIPTSFHIYLFAKLGS